MSGRDRLEVVTFPNIVTAETCVLNEFLVSPKYFKMNSRLSKVAANWEKYRFVKFTVDYVPSVPSTISGQLIMSFDPDPEGTVAGGDYQTVAEFCMNRQRSVMFSINEHKRVSLNCDPKLGINDWFVDLESNGEIKLTAQGRFDLVVSTPLISGSQITQSLVVGTLFADWEVILKQPQRAQNTGAVTSRSLSEYLNWEYWAPLLELSADVTYFNCKSTYAVTNGFKFINNSKGVCETKNVGYVANANNGNTKAGVISDMMAGRVYVCRGSFFPIGEQWRTYTLKGITVTALTRNTYIFFMNNFSTVDNSNPLRDINVDTDSGCRDIVMGVRFLNTQAGNMQIGYYTDASIQSDSYTRQVTKCGDALQGQILRLLARASMWSADSEEAPRLSKTQIPTLEDRLRKIEETLDVNTSRYEGEFGC